MISRAGRSLLAAAVHRAFAKELLFSNEARAKLMEGADILADAVKVTLGPSGRNVLIEQSFGSPKITKDGVTVAKAIDLPDKAANIGANLIKNVASKTNDEAGDGTTTATVLARSIFQESLKYLNSRLYSCNTTQVKKGMDLAVAHIVERLKAQAVPVKEKEVLEQVATISANGDRDIGKIIAETLHKVGEKGSVTVTDGKTLKHEVEYIEGMKFDQGYVSPYFATNLKTQKVEFDDAFVLLLEKKVSNVKHLLNVL
jgi:chaperonin GroEL